MKLKKNNCINIFVLLFLTVFPLFFDNYYINITITKYNVSEFYGKTINQAVKIKLEDTPINLTDIVFTKTVEIIEQFIEKHKNINKRIIRRSI